jgi:hypothetical protein
MENSFSDINYIIKNGASKTVSFSFNDTTVSLDSDQSETFVINSGKGRFAPKNLNYSGHSKSITTDTKNMGLKIEYTFIDNPCYPLNVINMLPVSVTIQAGDYIDNSGVTLTILENDTETSTIYTSNPTFTVTLISTSYPVIVDWKFENGQVYVIIR